MVTYALPAERQVEIRDINHPLVAYQRQKLDDVGKKLVETKHSCVELMNAFCSSEKEVVSLESPCSQVLS
jgi:hypothetical protein